MRNSIASIKILIAQLLSVYFLCLSATAQASYVIEWDAPTQNVDGTPLTDLAGYEVQLGSSSGLYKTTLRIGTQTQLELNALTAGATYYVAVLAYDTANNRSSYSNEISFAVSLNDSDGDGVTNPSDNCPNISNPDQKDSNSNGVGDACESMSNPTPTPTPTPGPGDGNPGGGNPGNPVPGRASPYDFDGDGVSDAYKQLGTSLMVELSGSEQIQARSLPAKKSKFAFGDFDGDSSTDFALMLKKGAKLEWQMFDRLSTDSLGKKNLGKATSTLSASCYLDSDIMADPLVVTGNAIQFLLSSQSKIKSLKRPNSQVITSVQCFDYNADGTDEILLTYKEVVSKKVVHSLGLITVGGKKLVTQKISSKDSVIFADSDNDGTREIVTLSKSGASLKLLKAAGSKIKVSTQAINVPAFSKVIYGTFLGSDNKTHDGLLITTKNGKVYRYNFLDDSLEEVIFE